MSRLILVDEGADPPVEYALRAQLTIGRTRCDITIDDPSVARRHAVVEHFSSGYGVRALQSDALVEVNDEPITVERILAVGDRIRIGGTTLRVDQSDAPLMRAALDRPRGDVPAPDLVPATVSALVAAAGVPTGEFAPAGAGGRRRGSQATRSSATFMVFLIVLADAIAIVIYLSSNS